MENKKDFSTYPVWIDTEKKTFILFGVIFSIIIIVFFCFFYQSESRKSGLTKTEASLMLRK